MACAQPRGDEATQAVTFSLQCLPAGHLDVRLLPHHRAALGHGQKLPVPGPVPGANTNLHSLWEANFNPMGLDATACEMQMLRGLGTDMRTAEKTWRADTGLSLTPSGDIPVIDADEGEGLDHQPAADPHSLHPGQDRGSVFWASQAQSAGDTHP